MKKTVLDLKISQKRSKKVTVNGWVSTAMSAQKRQDQASKNEVCGKKMEVNMAISKTVLDKR